MSDVVQFHAPEPADEPVKMQPVFAAEPVKKAAPKTKTGSKYQPYKLGQ